MKPTRQDEIILRRRANACRLVGVDPAEDEAARDLIFAKQMDINVFYYHIGVLRHKKIKPKKWDDIPQEIKDRFSAAVQFFQRLERREEATDGSCAE